MIRLAIVILISGLITACGSGGSTALTSSDYNEPKVYETYPRLEPLTGVLNRINIDGTITITFDKPIDDVSLKKEDFELRNIDTGYYYPITWDYSKNDYQLRITSSEEFEFNANLELVIAAGISDVNGNATTQPFVLPVGVRSDYIGPNLISSYPDTGAVNIGVSESFTIEFDEAVNPESFTDNGRFLLLIDEDHDPYNTESVDLLITVENNKVIFTPKKPLFYDSQYEIGFLNWHWNHLTDLAGNRANGLSEISFRTEPYPNKKVALNHSVHTTGLNRLTNELYLLSAESKTLTVFDMGTDEIVNSFSLEHVPSRVCIHNETDTLFITHSDIAVISQYRISDLSKLDDIAWSGGNGEKQDDHLKHYDILCSSDSIFVADTDTSPTLFQIGRSHPYPEQETSIDSAGGMVMSESGDIFTFTQFGWDFTSGYRRLERFSNTGTQWARADRGYNLGLNQLPQDSPIFIDEQSGTVINKYLVANAADLSQKIHEFDKSETIYATDASMQLAATKRHVYSLTDYSVLHRLPINGVDHVMFDNQGELYMVDNERLTLYKN